MRKEGKRQRGADQKEVGGEEGDGRRGWEEVNKCILFLYDPG